MKANELHPCDLCNNPLGLLFLKINMESQAVDVEAAKRSDGLCMMLGSVALARAMGTDEDITEHVDTWDKLVCFSCLGKSIAELMGTSTEVTDET